MMESISIGERDFSFIRNVIIIKSKAQKLPRKGLYISNLYRIDIFIDYLKDLLYL